MRSHAIFHIQLGSIFSAACKSAPVEATPQVAVKVLDSFSCEGSKSIEAAFSSYAVALTLSDKRKLVLQHALSASVARYATKDENIIFWNKGNTAFLQEQGITTYQTCTEVVPQAKRTLGLANPASESCINVGGKLAIEKRTNGSEYGVCYFEGNRACEDWALLRGTCLVGGFKTTGYDTADQTFCVLTGGKINAEQGALCAKP